MNYTKLQFRLSRYESGMMYELAIGNCFIYTFYVRTLAFHRQIVTFLFYSTKINPDITNISRRRYACNW